MKQQYPYSSQVKERDSSIELLRLISMLLVLITHVNFPVFGVPTVQDISISWIRGLNSIWLHFLTLVCVNVFVLISGYFSLKPSTKSVLALLYQVFFISLAAYIIAVTSGVEVFSVAKFIEVLIPIRNGGWFIYSYLGLLLFAPILNAFIDATSPKSLAKWIGLFFITQSIMGCVLEYQPAQLFNSGYSTVSFMGLYLIGRYIRLYGKEQKLLSYRGISYIAFYFIASFVLAIAYLAWILYQNNYIGELDRHLGRINSVFFAYSNPITILSSIALLVAFTKLKLRSRFINWIGVSVFSIYLLHDHFMLRGSYHDIFRYLSQYEYHYFISLSVFTLLLIALFAVLVDKVRIFTWQKILRFSARNKPS